MKKCALIVFKNRMLKGIFGIKEKKKQQTTY
jgi:hypothetical protein